MERCEKVVLKNMCMVYDGDRVLVLNRVSKNWGGIAFPGGHIEPHESFAESVIREIFEETGLTIKSPQLCGIKDWYVKSKRYIVLFYKTNQFSGALRSSPEGEVFWTDFDEIKTLNLAKDMADMIKVFRDDNLSEFHYYIENNDWKYAVK